ncbi:MAG TPA: hypothetical protein VHT31_01320, partial [Candidatus Acidoferrum sp.]|nr:hypothetical protein [Candidatus Acidoferrum sp.]
SPYVKPGNNTKRGGCPVLVVFARVVLLLLSMFDPVHHPFIANEARGAASLVIFKGWVFLLQFGSPLQFAALPPLTLEPIIPTNPKKNEAMAHPWGCCKDLAHLSPSFFAYR